MFNNTILSITEKTLNNPGESASWEEALELAALPDENVIDLLIVGIGSKKCDNLVFKA